MAPIAAISVPLVAVDFPVSPHLILTIRSTASSVFRAGPTAWFDLAPRLCLQLRVSGALDLKD
jgi:hypothetical protein